MKTGIHYGLHFLFPLLIAWFLSPKEWKKNYFLLLATMLVDVDHLFATPLFEENRNSIGYHPLHTYPMIVLYFMGSIFAKGNLRVICIGLFFHMVTDFIDYYAWH